MLKILSIVLATGAVVSIAMLLFVHESVRPTAPAPLASDRADRMEAELRELGARVARVEERERAERLAPPPVADEAGTGGARSPASGRETDEETAALEDVRGRLRDLEAAVAASVEPFRMGGSSERNPRSRPEPTDTLDLQGTVFDPYASVEEKLRALRNLRFRELEDGSDARTPEVVTAMLDVALSSEDAEVRADVYRQMDECRDPALREHLLYALQHDPHPEPREEAAESLAPFLPDAVVESALRQAMQSDPDEDVRDQARESLSGS